MGRGNLAANTEGPQSLECARARGEDRRSEVGPPTNISLCGEAHPHAVSLAEAAGRYSSPLWRSWAPAVAEGLDEEEGSAAELLEVVVVVCMSGVPERLPEYLE